VLLNTSNTQPEREGNTFGDPLETIWRNCVLALCGVGIFYRRTFSVIVTSTEDLPKEWLDAVRVTIDRFFPTEDV
jgi:NAD(P)H dehydrogenase (quinone)